MTRSINGKTAAVWLAACAFLLFSTTARADDASAKLYATKCAACHAADGSGNTAAGKALKTADLRIPDIQKQTDAELNTEITKGKDKMPAYEKQLKPDEIKGLVAYVRELAGKK
jgi:mono/diheme cytochrome c family protein